MEILELYGRKYGASNRDVIASLFTGPQTLNGTYKRRAGGVDLIDLQGVPRVFVSASGYAFTIHSEAGRRRLMCSTTTADEKWLNTPTSVMQTIEQARDAVRAISAKVAA